MNKVYRLVRSTATGQWVVASEFAKSHGKGGRRAAVAVLGLLSAQAALAQTVQMKNFNPLNCDQLACVSTVSGGADVTMNGLGTQVVRGVRGNGAGISLPDLFASGRTTSPYADPNNPLSLVINTGNPSVSLVVRDSTTGSNKTVMVYDNANIVDTHATSTGPGGSYGVVTSTAVNGLQYINTRIGQVDKTGGTLTVDIGDGGADSNTASNTISMVAKQSSLFYADGTGGAQSKVVWNSNNRVDMGDASSVANNGQAMGKTKLNFSQYTGSFTDSKGNAHSVNNAAELAAYNDFLIASLKSGALKPDDYATEFARAYTTTAQEIEYLNGPVDQTDEVYKTLGVRAVIHAVGANAVGEIAQGAHLDANVVSSTNGLIGAAMLADRGGTIINNGQLGSVRGGYSDSQYAMYAMGGGHAVNNGVVNAGSLTAAAGNHDPVDPAITMGVHNGIVASGTGSTADNTGILNISGPGSYGIRVINSASGSNSGIINLNVGDAQITGVGSRAGGVSVESGGSFVNDTSGEIYLGRGFQYDTATPAADTINGSSPMAGIYATGKSNVTNKGTITLGGLAQSAVGMYSNGTEGTFKNDTTGVINVNGAASDAPGENVGMYVINTTSSTVATNVENAGTINLNGINGIGIKAISSDNGKVISVTSSGDINVDGAKSAEGLRNYGVWAQGATTDVKVAGNVNLTGDGAIGVHARDGSKIKVDGGMVNFASGVDQIGFFAHSKGSSVEVATAAGGALEVSTDGSTLFRIEDGATINNTAGAELIASGAGSTAIQVTGVGSTANLDGMNITVSGVGANALKVEGGATGQMSGAANLTLEDGATAVVVDDNKYDINGNQDGGGESRFVNTADISVQNSQDVTIFRVKNGAELVNAGNIDLSHGTAIEVMGAGSRVLPDATGKLGTITVHDGVAGIYVHDGATLNTSDTITVDGSASGVLVGPDAGRVVIEQGAHITGLGSGYGNLITNRAEKATTLVDGATLEMAGSGAALLSENNIDSASHGYVLVSSQTQGKGIALSNADGSTTDGSLDIGNGWTIDVTGNGAGLYANTTGEMRVNGAQVNVSGPGNAIDAEVAGSVILSDDTVITGTNPDAQLVVGNPDTFVNNGTINSVDRNAVAFNLGDGASTVTNNGLITGLVALGEGDDCLHNPGTINGDVSLGGGNDCAYVTGGTINGDLAGDAGDDSIFLERATVGAVNGGSGADTIVLQGPDASTFTRLDGGIGAGETDSLVFDGYNHVYQAGSAPMENFERIDLINGSVLDLRESLALGDNNDGNGVLGIAAGSSLLANQGIVSVHGNVENAGLIQIGGDQVGRKLVVEGNYAGLGGTVNLNAALGDDASATDQLVVRGDTSGSTSLSVSNLGGRGSYTYADGIEVVHVDGQSAGDFALSGRAVAGAYEYLLAKGGKADPSNGNWYLRSEAPDAPTPPNVPTPPTPPTPPTVPKNPEQDTPPIAVQPQDPLPPTEPKTPRYRPETGAYLANQAAATGMFMQTLHDREGEPDWQERKRKADGSGGAAWARIQRDQFDATTGREQIETGTDTSVLQIGTELANWTDGDRRINAGVMAGMGRANSNASSSLYSAKGKVTGRSIGLYGTLYNSASEATGAYVDGWVQYGRFDNEVHGQLLQKERYNSSALTGSLEFGYAAEIASGDTSAFYIEPQAQVIYSRMSGGNHVESNGTQVRSTDAGGLTTRLGARFYTRQLSTEFNRVQPFAELNWWHGGNNAMSFDDVTMDQGRAEDIYELKVGAQMELGGGWTGWGHAGFQTGAGDHRNVQGMLGVKYGW